MTTDHNLTPSDRPLPTRVGLCDAIPGTVPDPLTWMRAVIPAGHPFGERRRTLIDGLRTAWTQAERDAWHAEQLAQKGMFAP